VILGRYATLKGYDKTAQGNMELYNDKTLISDWAREDMTWAVGAGLISGTDWGGLYPGGSSTRAELAAILLAWKERSNGTYIRKKTRGDKLLPVLQMFTAGRVSGFLEQADAAWRVSGEDMARVQRIEAFLKKNQELTETVKKGDIDRNGKVDLTDLMMCLNHVSKKKLLEGDALSAADIDGKDGVTLSDLMRILNYVSKKITEL